MKITKLSPLDSISGKEEWLIESFILGKRLKVDSEAEIKPTFTSLVVEEGMKLLQLSTDIIWQTQVMTEVGKQNSLGLEYIYSQFSRAENVWASGEQRDGITG